jgi:tetratricopeptide (TPR) repeat protein
MMRRRHLWLLTIPIIVFCALIAMTQQQTDQLGIVHFPISCRAESQAAFNRAISLLHGAWVQEASQGFAALTESDSDCAMAYWGMAMSLLANPMRLPVNPKALRQGWAAVVHAKRLGGPTPREQAYIDAVEVFFMDPDCLERSGRELAYEQAMAQLSRHYPEDREAAAFYALALLMSVTPTDTTDVSRLKAAAILEQMLIEQPDHPGVRLYLLQTDDTPALAQRGFLLARQSAKLAAVGPYALHLSSHIFTRLGLWEEAVRANLAAIAAVTVLSAGRSASMATSQRLHAMDALVYAYLQRGEERAAKHVLDELQANPPDMVEDLAGAYAVAAIPAGYALERSCWAEAAALTRQPLPQGLTQFPQAEAVTLFAQALGAARSGDLEHARQALGRLEALHHSLVLTRQEEWAAQVEIQQRVVEAWIARAERRHGDALRLMQSGVFLEASHHRPSVMPGPLASTRELLAELLLERGHLQEAQQEFETRLHMEPQRLNALYGVAHTAELDGNLPEAASFYEDLLALRAEAASQDTPFAQARAFLANINLER